MTLTNIDGRSLHRGGRTADAKSASGERLIRRKIVSDRTGLPTSTLYDAMKAARFPKPVKIGPNAVAWRESQVDAWIAERCGEAA